VGKIGFEQLVKENQEPLRRFLMNLCDGNGSLSDDLAQEAFIKAYLNFSSFRGDSRFSSWLFRIAYNCFCDHIRKNKNALPEIIAEYESSQEDSSELLLSPELKNQELYMALARLKTEEKTSILLFYMEDRSIKEISKITSMPENTVKSHLFRAKLKMSDYLQGEGYER
jgi:RNA polymerase sigma-70 factor (ECF subfamily)